MNFTKEDLKKAFEQGEKYDYRPTWTVGFNRWYNETYIDSSKCKTCEFNRARNNKNCKTCDEFSNFKEELKLLITPHCAKSFKPSENKGR